MAQEIPLVNLLYLLLPLGLCAWLYYRWCGEKAELSMAAIRMVAQLLLIGYALNYLFTADSWWVGLAIVVIMSVTASWIAVRPFRSDTRPVFRLCWLAVSAGSLVVFVLVYYGVLATETLYQPRTFIPIAGMIFSSAMNTVSLCGERYCNERMNGQDYQQARSAAFRASMIPKVNSFLAVGLVSLPGMMTGQILSGVDPLIAVRYQIMVMLMLLGSGGLSAALFLVFMQPRERPE